MHIIVSAQQLEHESASADWRVSLMLRWVQDSSRCLPEAASETRRRTQRNATSTPTGPPTTEGLADKGEAGRTSLHGPNDFARAQDSIRRSTVVGRAMQRRGVPRPLIVAYLRQLRRWRKRARHRRRPLDTLSWVDDPRVFSTGSGSSAIVGHVEGGRCSRPEMVDDVTCWSSPRHMFLRNCTMTVVVQRYCFSR